MRKKAEYEKNIALSEAILEAVPTTLIIFVSWLRIRKEGISKKDKKRLAKDKFLILILTDFWHTFISGLDDESLGSLLTDGDSTQFLITFFFSVFSASFGLAKCLKNGVAGTFQPGGVLDGLCSVQFLLAFLGPKNRFLK